MKCQETDKKKKAYYLPLFLPCPAWPSNSWQECRDGANCLCFDSFSLLKQKHVVVTNQFTISVFDRFHWGDGEQIKAETVITEIRWDLADVFKRRTGLHDKRKLNGSGIWECFLFFFFFLNKVRLTKTNISDSTILWVLEAYRFCKVKTSWWFVSLRFK